MKYIEGFRDPAAAKALVARLRKTAKELPPGRTVAVMEVCGSHTMAISRYGIRSMLPDNVRLISGPGCPVCVTDVGYVDAALELAQRGVTIATFGDMVRVPGTRDTLAQARARGARVEVCYSPIQALDIAQKTEGEVVFLAIGFETTVPPVVSLVPRAQERGIDNLSLLTAFKLVPPALEALVADPDVAVDAFICPAHVSAIIGSEAYRPFVERHGIPCVVCGFEPLDILWGLVEIVAQCAGRTARLVNQYDRVVTPQGNQVAQRLMDTYLTPVDAAWRGIGVIPQSGLGLRPEFAAFDAARRFSLDMSGGKARPGCRCGDVLKGKIAPDACPLFAKVCTPVAPVGPCMVSSEGSCAAYYKYERKTA